MILVRLSSEEEAKDHFEGNSARQFNIQALPQNQRDSLILSMHHATAKLPVITNTTATHMKHKPDGSKENNGINTFEVIT